MVNQISTANLVRIAVVLGVFFAFFSFAGEKASAASAPPGSALVPAVSSPDHGVTLQWVDRGEGHRGHEYREHGRYRGHYYPRRYSYPRGYYARPYPYGRYAYPYDRYDYRYYGAAPYWGPYYPPY